ncbi:MAG: hypothetical protein PHQ27_06730 [Victivallales bacterium]|nr:hypothetical protein [Victivallales bacterium]
MKYLPLAVLSAAAMILAAGCNSVVSVSPSTTPITAKDTYTKLGPARGQSGSVLLLGFLPFGSSSPSKDARDSAIASKNANALIEVTEDYSTLSLLILQYNWTTVEGTAIKFERKGADVE